MNNRASMQNTEYSQKAKCIPITVHILLNVNVNMKPKIQQKLAVKAEATALRLVGNISPIMAQGSGPKPKNIFYLIIIFIGSLNYNKQNILNLNRNYNMF